MADITIYKPAGVNVVVLDGDPPPDQTALVAQLQADVAARDARIAAKDAALQAAATAISTGLAA
jgi:hypothetical protein